MLISCSTKKDTVDANDLIQSLPKIQTPVTYRSDSRANIVGSAEIDTAFMRKMINEGFGPMGRLFEANDFYAIIGAVPNDTGSPEIRTIDKKGKQIASHILWETAGADMGYYSTNIVTIFPDRTILFKDSVMTRKINSEGTNEIEGTDSVSVTTKKY